MRTQWLILALFLLVVGPVSAHEGVRTRSRVAEALQGASGSLDRYQKLAASFRCDESDPKARNECKEMFETLNKRVEEARKKIEEYATSPTKTAALFDVYQAFLRIKEITDMLPGESRSYSVHDGNVSGEVYNNFVKVPMWLGAVLREKLESSCAN
jgi:hypothetical protein